MLVKFCQLRRKEVINLCDGCKLGYVGDLEVCLPEGTVKTRVSRAKQQLRKTMTQEVSGDEC